jgi:hypothetical protein
MADTHSQFEGKQELSLSFQIMGPEAIARPYHLAGQAVHLSASTMEACIQEMPADLYPHLLACTRDVQVSFSDPSSGSPATLIGRVVRFVYHKSKVSAKSGPCLLGIVFEAAA